MAGESWLWPTPFQGQEVINLAYNVVIHLCQYERFLLPYGGCFNPQRYDFPYLRMKSTLASCSVMPSATLDFS